MHSLNKFPDLLSVSGIAGTEDMVVKQTDKNAHPKELTWYLEGKTLKKVNKQNVQVPGTMSSERETMCAGLVAWELVQFYIGYPETVSLNPLKREIKKAMRISGERIKKRYKAQHESIPGMLQ